MLHDTFSLELENEWKDLLAEEAKKPYFRHLIDFLSEEYGQKHEVYPKKELIFHAFSLTPYRKVKVVLVGQDPYHGKGQAHGLAFSVPRGEKPPPSLKNIQKELKRDLGLSSPLSGCLEPWARQGVLLLNTTLTVREGAPLSHQNRGWETFTDAVVRALLERKDPLVFLLWGKKAQEKFIHLGPQIEKNCHVVLQAAHPSPFSAHRGFFGCSHFSKVNQWLKKWGKEEIAWDIKNL